MPNGAPVARMQYGILSEVWDSRIAYGLRIRQTCLRRCEFIRTLFSVFSKPVRICRTYAKSHLALKYKCLFRVRNKLHTLPNFSAPLQKHFQRNSPLLFQPRDVLGIKIRTAIQAYKLPAKQFDVRIIFNHRPHCPSIIIMFFMGLPCFFLTIY